VNNPPPAVPDFVRAESIKKSSRCHYQPLFLCHRACGQSTSEQNEQCVTMRTLRHHQLQTNALHTIVQATVVTNLSYTSTHRCRCAEADDKLSTHFLSNEPHLYSALSCLFLVTVITASEVEQFTSPSPIQNV